MSVSVDAAEMPAPTLGIYELNYTFKECGSSCPASAIGRDLYFYAQQRKESNCRKPQGRKPKINYSQTLTD